MKKRLIILFTLLILIGIGASIYLREVNDYLFLTCILTTLIGFVGINFQVGDYFESPEDLEKLTQEKMDKELDDIQNKDIEWDNEFEEPDYEWMAEVERGR